MSKGKGKSKNYSQSQKEILSFFREEFNKKIMKTYPEKAVSEHLMMSCGKLSNSLIDLLELEVEFRKKEKTEELLMVLGNLVFSLFYSTEFLSETKAEEFWPGIKEVSSTAGLFQDLDLLLKEFLCLSGDLFKTAINSAVSGKALDGENSEKTLIRCYKMLRIVLFKSPYKTQEVFSMAQCSMF